jgi:hypothetical protein
MSRLDRAYRAVDDRFDLEGAQSFLGKAFPAEDSFLLGEVALFCFVILVLSGTFLGFFFEPSTSQVEYEGSIAEYQGEEMPEAYVSVLNITYDVPFGMLIRRLHHWAAHLFVASLGLHMLRVFFTGAYRNPREPNWLVGAGLAGASMFAAYTGYALPFDEVASTAADTYGQPFADVFEDHDWNFQQIPKDVFAPAKVTIDVRGGDTHVFGETDEELLAAVAAFIGDRQGQTPESVGEDGTVMYRGLPMQQQSTNEESTATGEKQTVMYRGLPVDDSE